MSNHLPIWIQIKNDIDAFRLNQIVQGASVNVAMNHGHAACRFVE